MITARAALLALFAAATALPSGSTAQLPPIQPSELRAVLDDCLKNETPWNECYLDAKQRGKLADSRLNEAQTCVIAGGDPDYCFPFLEYRNSGHPLVMNDSWFFFRPRSLWTPTPYDLLHGNDG